LARTDGEANSRGPPKREPNQQEQNDTNHANGRVLAVHVGTRALLDGGRNALHLFVTRWPAQNPKCHDQSVKHGQACGAERQP
jgi:hypothetical protein